MRTTLLALALICTPSAAQLAAADTDYQDETFNTPVAEEPVDPRPPMVGINMSPAPTHAQKSNGITPDQGVYVRGVFPNTAANDMGVQPGDIIITVNGSDTNSMQGFRDIVNGSRVGDDLSMTVMRNGEQIQLDGAFKPWLDSVPKSTIDASAERRYRNMQQRRLDRRMGVEAQQHSEAQQQLAAQQAANPTDATPKTARGARVAPSAAETPSETLAALGFPTQTLPAIRLSGAAINFTFSMSIVDADIIAADADPLTDTPPAVAVESGFFDRLAPDFSMRFHMDVNDAQTQRSANTF